MFTVERRVGRLVEARVFRLATVSDAEHYGYAFRGQLLTGQPVLMADHRPVVIYPQDVADKLIEIFRGMNRHWARAALLIAPSNATLSLQIQRVVRESQNLSRRVFTDSREAIRFIGDLLQPDEAARVEAFLDEAPHSAPPASVPPPTSVRPAPASVPPTSVRPGSVPPPPMSSRWPRM